MSELRTRAAASSLAFASLLCSTGAVAATGDLPDLGPNFTVGRMPAGGTVIVRPAAGAPVAAIELWYRAPSTGFDSTATPGMARLAAQVVAASKPIVGKPLGKLVSDLGGRLSVAVYSDSVAISASVPASAARDVVKAMTTSYFAPVVTDDGFKSAQRDVASEAFVSTFDPETLVRDAVFADLFTAGPQHYPSLGPPRDLENISIDAVRGFAKRAFRSSNATLVVSGAVDPTLASAAVAGRPDDGIAEAPMNGTPATAVAPVTKYAQPSGGGYGWIGPAIASQREATAMDFIADYLFRSDDGVVTREVADKYPDAFVVGQFITLHDPGVMFVAFGAKDDSGVRAIVDAGFEAVRKPLDPQQFSYALASFKYHILSDLQTPSQLADNFGWYAVEGAVEYAPGANGEGGPYFKAADSLTPDFVASVAEKYLGGAPASVTLRPEPKLKTSTQ